MQEKNKINYKHNKVFWGAISFAILSISIIAYSLLDKKTKVSNYNTGKTDIIIINLKENNDINLLLIIGIFFLIIAFFSITYLFISKNTTNSSTKTEIKLTSKEIEILALIKEGKSNKEIASELFISVSTVKSHIHSIFKKLGVSKRVEIT